MTKIHLQQLKRQQGQFQIIYLMAMKCIPTYGNGADKQRNSIDYFVRPPLSGAI